jgi:sec-independent protein translocase protein TatB
MIELSLGKMVLLALIALIVLGPEKLPGAARTAGALLRRLRSGWDNVRAEVERELEIEEIKRSAREAVAGAEAAQQHVQDTLKSAHDPFAQAAAMVKLQPSSSSSDTPSKPEDMTSKERVTNRNSPKPQPDAVASADPLAPTATASTENHAHESPSTERASHDPFTDAQSLEGVQSELPLDEPPMNFAHDESAHETSRQHSNLYEKDAPHGNA